MKYSVILNVYKRENKLEDQIKAIERQTKPPAEILIWNNGNAKAEKIIKQFKSKIPIISTNCSTNLGVWARFSYALNARSEFLLMLDDDVIPGKKWVENCFNQFKEMPGVYGTRGVRFLSPNRYTPLEFYGWKNPNEQTIEVDIIGHSWFFKTEWLASYWGLASFSEMQVRAGEDMQLSFAVQQDHQLRSFVPPHPIDDMEMWGHVDADDETASDGNAISLRPDAYLNFDKALSNITNRGFRTYYSQNKKVTEGLIPIVNTNIMRRPWLVEVVKKNEFFHTIISATIKKLRQYGIHL